MRSLLKCALLALAMFGLSQADVKFPFPQISDYDGHATLLSNKKQASEDLRAAFAYWLKEMYADLDGVAAVRFNPGSDTCVSEGIGYGMLMMVYFSDNTTSYQTQFDKLWEYYKKFMNGNGLMNWKTRISTLKVMSDGSGAALDGDIDVAAALVMAYHQFGDEKYLKEAKTLIQNIKKYEFEEEGLHLPGDSWGEGGYSRKNPGYFDPAYMPIFAAVDVDHAEFWSTKAYDANVKLLEAAAKEVPTGLIDDWTDRNGKGEDDLWNYDATRIPWRNAKAVCWYGDERVAAVIANMAAFVSKIEAKNLSGKYTRSTGETTGDRHNSAFLSSLMSSLVVNPAYQSRLDEYWVEAVSLGDENYFNQSLKILNGLLVSGNMPDLTTATPRVEESSSSEPESSSSAEEPESSSSAEEPLSSSAEEPESSSSEPVVESSESIPESSSVAEDAVAAKSIPAPMFELAGRMLHMALFGNARVDLISATGVVVKSLWNGYAAGSVNVSLQDVPSGVYLVRVSILGSNILQKLNVR